MSDRIEFLGLCFESAPTDDIASWIRVRTSSSSYAYVVTPNVDHVVRFSQASDRVRQSYIDADKCVCDSRVLRGLARLCGIHLTVTTGSDLVAQLFARLLDHGDRVCLIGSTGETAMKLAQRFPLFEIVHHDAPMGLIANDAARQAAISFARETGARIILLAVGSPQQELLAHEMGGAGDLTGTALCIGASVDFLVGAQKRAPVFVQRAGLEWAWRLATQPRRLARRYLIDCPMVFPIAAEWWWKQKRQT